MDRVQHVEVTGGNADADDSLARLTVMLRAGLPGSQTGADLQSSLVAGTDPFTFFGSPGDSAAKSRHSLPVDNLSKGAASGAAVVDRRVAVMTQDMAAFGGVDRQAPTRLDAPADSVPLDYFA